VADVRVRVHGWHGRRMATAWEPLREGVRYGMVLEGKYGRVDDMARVRAAVERALPDAFVVCEEPDWCGLILEAAPDVLLLRERLASLEFMVNDVREKLRAAGAERWADEGSLSDTARPVSDRGGEDVR
jgi:hypothetical protein